MSSTTSPSFSKTGLAYAQGVTDLEVARRTFLAERKALLKALAVVERDALARVGLEAAEDPDGGKEPKDDISQWEWKTDRRFTAVWNEGRSKDKRDRHRSGIQLELRS